MCRDFRPGMPFKESLGTGEGELGSVGDRGLSLSNIFLG